MSLNLEFVDVGFCLLFVVWILWGGLKMRRERVASHSSPLSPKITISLNFVISLSYLGYFLGELWVFKIVSIDAVFSSIVWFFACMVAVYSVSFEQERWPLLLIVWWWFSSSCDLVRVVFYLLHHREFFVNFQNFLPKSNVIDFASLPLSLLLFINALRANNKQQMSDFTEPLIATQLDDDLGGGTDPFSSAGLWGHITFRWLNPLLSKGHQDELQFEDVPPIPQTETADEASLLLQEFLREQKTLASSLPNAIFDALRTPLAKNAVFAGISVFSFSKHYYFVSMN